MKKQNLLGLILVREGILSAAQLQQALDRQAALRQHGTIQPLGQLVLELGFASEGQLRHALKLQNKLAWGSDEAVPLGMRLVTGGLIAPSLLVSLLDERDRTGESLETLLIDRQIVQAGVIAHFSHQPG